MGLFGRVLCNYVPMTRVNFSINLILRQCTSANELLEQNILALKKP